LTPSLLLVCCGCNDGNAIDGDGCGADCQIEPCYTCAGDPSVCTPSPDGAACDDRHDCTTGESCSAGACGGGSAIASCTDLTGTLDVHFASIIDETFTADVVQRNGTFFLGGFVGAVDQTAGTVRLSQPIVDFTFVNCPPGAFNVLAPLPLIVQLQRVNGSCFEADYGSDGVVRNDPATGRFKAHGTP
jgi:hypothetical protein